MATGQQVERLTLRKVDAMMAPNSQMDETALVLRSIGHQLLQPMHFGEHRGRHNIRRTDYSESFRTYGLEWSEKYLFTYIDKRLLQVFFISFQTKPNMWDRGNFGQK